jgi:hypothetical protein
MSLRIVVLGLLFMMIQAPGQNYSDKATGLHAQPMCLEGCAGGTGISCFHCTLKVTPKGASEYCGGAPCGVPGTTGCQIENGHCRNTGSSCATYCTSS